MNKLTITGGNNMEYSSTGDDRVLPLTRILSAIIVPFLVAAFVMLYIFPDRSDVLFAWPIRPRMSAMMLGATYIGGAVFFTRVILTKHWHTVKLGLLPVSAFAAFLGIATIIHWDSFTHGHISFRLWTLLYFVLPFVIPVVWFVNQKHDPKPVTPDMPSGLKIFFAAEGVILVVVSLLLMAAPALMIPTWPWTLSPLTSRVMAAMFILPGLVGFGIALTGKRDSARIILEAQIIAVILILGAVPFASTDFNWTRPVSWFFVVGMSVLLVALIAISFPGKKRLS